MRGTRAAQRTARDGTGADLVTAEMLVGYAAAEIRAAVLLPCRADHTLAGDPASNLFTVLAFHASPPPANSDRFRFITVKPLSVPSKRCRLAVAHLILEPAEALPVATFSDSFVLQDAQLRQTQVNSRGSWLEPVFVGQEQHPIHECLPRIPGSFRFYEHVQDADVLRSLVEASDLPWLFGQLGQKMQARLDRRPDRLGSVVVVLPQLDGSMHTSYSHDGRRIAVRMIGGSTPTPKAIAHVRGVRDGHTVFASLVHLDRAAGVLPCSPNVSHRTVEVYDHDSGALLDRESGVPLRQINVRFSVNPRIVRFVVPCPVPPGQEAAAPIEIRTQWRSFDVRTQVGHGHTDWELAQRRATLEADRRRRQSEKRFLLYRGSTEDRERAVADIRYLLNHRCSDYVKIWDPYFGPADALRFLPYVDSPDIKISILTSNKVPPAVQSTDGPVHEQRPSARCAPRIIRRWIRLLSDVRSGSSNSGAMANLVRRIFAGLKVTPANSEAAKLAEWKRRELRAAIKLLREPNPGLQGLQTVACRIGGGRRFHDRFIISSSYCWQLGCSLNHLGSVISTVTEFPHPGLIEEEFDSAWREARNLDEVRDGQ